MTAEEITKVNQFQREGYGYKKNASLTGLPVNTVKTHCRRHPISKEDTEAENALCKMCGKKLEQTPHKRKRIFCSNACRLKWWNSHRKQINRKSVHSLTCAYCGQAFESYENAHRKFCSRKCYGLSRRKEEQS